MHVAQIDREYKTRTTGRSSEICWNSKITQIGQLPYRVNKRHNCDPSSKVLPSSIRIWSSSRAKNNKIVYNLCSNYIDVESILQNL